MAWKKDFFGTLADGREASRYTLENEQGVSASFTDLGGIWLTMVLPGADGQPVDVVLGYDSVEKYTTCGGHLGEIVGRNANRIGGASFSLNGVTYPLEANNGPNNLHSGPDFYRDRIWNTELEETELGTKIIFTLTSPDGDQGYPGNAEIAVSYTLTHDNSIRIDYWMSADADTVANFTHHAYFNLAGHASGPATDHVVWIDADAYTPTDGGSIPTGEIAPVSGTPMDFTSPKPLAKDIDADFEALHIGGGYDHNWVLNHAPGELSLSASVTDPASGRKMEVYTDLPGIQLYTANGLKSTVPAKDGAWYGPRGAYCFETQYFPDAVNKPQFASPILKAGEEYRTTTIYHFIFD